MTKEKIFSLKIASDGQGALKEQVHKHMTGDQTKIKVTFALDSELRIVEPFISRDGVFVDSNVLATQMGLNIQDFLTECKKDNKSIFFTLGSLTYICVHNIVLDKGVIVKNNVSLYVPIRIEKSGLVCNDVSIAFPRQSRNVLANNYLNYSMNRI